MIKAYYTKCLVDFLRVNITHEARPDLLPISIVTYYIRFLCILVDFIISDFSGVNLRNKHDMGLNDLHKLLFFLARMEIAARWGP